MNMKQGAPRHVTSVPSVSAATAGPMDQQNVYRRQAPQPGGGRTAPVKQPKQAKPKQPRQPDPGRRQPSQVPARGPQQADPLNGLLLPIIAGALAVVGTLLLVIGVFLLKDPDPEIVYDTPSQNVTAQWEDQKNSQSAEGEDSQPAEGGDSQPAEGEDA